MTREDLNVYFSPQAKLDLLDMAGADRRATEHLMGQIGAALRDHGTEREYVAFNRKRVTTGSLRFEFDEQYMRRSVTVVRVTARRARKGRKNAWQVNDGAPTAVAAAE